MKPDDDLELNPSDSPSKAPGSSTRLRGTHLIFELDDDFVPQPSPISLEPFIKALENPPEEDAPSNES